MWMKMLLVAGLLSYLVMPIEGSESTSAPNVEVSQHGVSQVVLTLDGKLVYHDGRGPRILEWEPWIGPGLETSDSWFGLDFGGNKKLLQQAEKLYGKNVRITGRLEKRTLPGLIPHEIDVLVVSALQPVAVAQQTVHVKIKGQLSQRLVVDNFNRIPEDLLPLRTWSVWEIAVNGTTYQLDFGGDLNLEARALQCDGRTVILTGTREGKLVHVRSLKVTRQR